MKNLLCLSLMLAPLTPSANAQTAAPAVSRLQAAPLSDQNGYSKLVEAGKLVLPGENGSPSAMVRNLTPQENLRRQRLAVARNASALKLLREALKMPIVAPTIETDADMSASFAPNSKLRELARQLVQESAVRLADGDAADALDSRLTALDLGAAASQGPIINALVGVAIEAVARRDFEVVAAKLDATQIRAALVRLKAIRARRATYSETLRVEKSLAVRFALLNSKEFLDASPEKKLLGIEEMREELKISEAEAREIIALTPQTLTEQLSRLLDGFVARGELSFQSALKAKPTPVTNVFVRNLAFPFDGNVASTRFNYERNRAADLVLQGALELRATYLESGAYPAIYAAPLDPFGEGKPLIYERKGESYLLYSVGPDGIDNRGRPFPATRQRFDPDTGLMRTIASRAVQADSRGDILAPVF